MNINYRRITTLVSSLALVAASLVPLTSHVPQALAASTLPAYRYTKLIDATNGRAAANSVATDSTGNVYVAGYFKGTVTFDGTGGSDTQTDASGSNDAFLTKYNANGSYAYTKTFDTTNGSAGAYGVATDSTGNVYITGYFSGTVTFDGPGGSDTQNAGGNDSSFLTKYNANGSYAYTKRFDTSGGSADAYSVATDSTGNVYITGYFDRTVTFDGPGGSDTQNAGGNDSSFLTKYNANGSYAYTKTFDTANGEADANNVATDSTGNVYFAGYFDGTVTFDGAGGSDSQTDAGGNGNAFLTKYNANGSYAYTKTFDTTSGNAGASSVAIDSTGNVYITGGFSGTVTFDGTGGTDTQTNAGNDSSFLTKYNANGSYAYTKRFDTTNGNADANSVVTDSTGNAYITGNFSGTVTFDGTGGSDVKTTSGDWSTFLTKYNADGSYAYTRVSDATTSNDDAFFNGLAMDKLGNLYIADSIAGTVTFDGTDTRSSGSETGGITSYRVYDPAVSTGPGATAPGAPDTGFAVVSAHPAVTLGATVLAAGSIFVLAKRNKRSTAPARIKATRKR